MRSPTFALPSYAELWREALRGHEAVALAFGFPAADAQPASYSRVELALSRERLDQLAEFRKDDPVSQEDVLTGCYALLIGIYLDREDVLVGLEVPADVGTGPGQGEASPSGCMLPLRLAVEPGLSVQQYLQKVAEATRRLREHAPVSPAEASAAMGHPLQAVLAFRTDGVTAQHQPPDGVVLALAIHHSPGLTLQVTYDAACFDEASVRGFAARYDRLLGQLVTSPQRLVGQLELLNPEEYQQIVVTWNQTSAPFSTEKTPLALFEQRARSAPQRLAVQQGERRLSYAELDALAARFAVALRARGVGAGALVAVHLPRCPEWIAWLLAAWKVGAAYLPLDVAIPPERLRWTIEDSGAALLVTQSGLAAGKELAAEQVLLCDAVDWNAIGCDAIGCDAIDRDRSTERPASTQTPAVGDRAYVIYTSGSSGRPKGVVVAQQSLLNLITWHQRERGVTERDRGTQLAGLGFDATVIELWPYLTAGAAICMPDFELPAPARQLRDWLIGQAVTVAFLPTPMTEELLAEQWPPGIALRMIFTAGDRLKCRPRVGLPFTLINDYGPAENTVAATWAIVEPRGRGYPPIGRPVCNVQTYVLDRCLRPLPVGVPGELHLGGAGLARGYLNRPELTRSRFIRNPFAAEPSARMYKTGDRVRYLPDGQLEFLGRVDNQVKVRGVRVELPEIEAAIEEAAVAVQQAVVLLREAPGGPRLIAWLTTDGSAPADAVIGELREKLPRRLPRQLLPSSYMALDAFPLTPNGKIDRQALPDPGRARPALRQPLVAARSPREAALVELWKAALQLDEIGVEDDFFELGGDSLQMVRILSRLRAEGLPCTPSEFLAGPTIGALAERLAHAPGPSPQAALQAQAANAAAKPAPPVRDSATPLPGDLEAKLSRAEDSYPLSPLQQGMLFHTLRDADRWTYLVQIGLTVDGALDALRLRLACQAVLQRHPILRTSFHWSGLREPLQIVQSAAPLPWTELDWRAATAQQKEEYWRELVGADRAKGFALDQAPLLRLTLVRYGEHTHRLLCSQMHLLMAEWEVFLVFDEIFATYERLRRGEATSLPAPRPFADFIAHLKDADPQRAEAFWRQTLAGYEPAALTFGLPRLDVAPGQGAQLRKLDLRLSAELTPRLKDFARTSRLTVNTLLTGVFGLLLERYTDRDDVVFGLTLSGRAKAPPGMEDTVGLFINTLPLRLRPQAGIAVQRYLQTVQDAVFQISEYEQSSLVDIRRWSEAGPGATEHELFEAILVFDEESLDSHLNRRGTSLAFRDFEVHEGSNYPLTAVLIKDEELLIQLIYDERRFDAASMDAFARSYARLIEQILDDPARELGTLQVLSQQDYQRIVVAWNDTAVDYPWVGSVPELFADRVQSAPAALAVQQGARRLSYAELDALASQLAVALQERGAQPGALIAINVERSPEWLATALASWKIGAAFLSTEPQTPAARLRFMMEDSGAAFLVTRRNTEGERALPAAQVVTWEEVDRTDGGRLLPVRPAASSDRAYVLYTSGSQGQPKGVVISHGALHNFVCWARSELRITNRDRGSHLCALSFDPLILEVWPLLTAGATLCLPDFEIPSPPETLRDWLISEQITVATFLVTPLAEELFGIDWPKETPFRLLTTGGDRLKVRPPAGLPFALFNGYGPTENTVYSTYGHVPAQAPAEQRFPSIGRPLANVQTYILDRHLRPVPVGVVGELYLGGASLADGYLNRPELTQSRFVPSPFATAPGARLYKTGDLVRYLHDGQIDFIGRADSQIKILGFRIELGEIESAIKEAAPQARQVIVVAREAQGRKHLLAYLTTDGSAPDEELVAQLKRELALRLPRPMIPSAFVILTSFPTTPSGKIDRRALPEPELVREVTRPATSVQEILCGIWAEVLQLPEVGTQENFLALGGHSLRLTRLLSRIREVFQTDVSLAELFERQTVVEQAALISARRTGDRQGLQIRTLPRDPGARSPLSSSQKRLWFLSVLNPASPEYNIVARFQLRGALNVAALEAALGDLVRRHPMLRARFGADGGEPYQVIDPYQSVQLERLSCPAGTEPSACVQALIERESLRSFELARGGLARFFIVEQEPGRSVFVLNIHHIVLDGWSLELFLKELSAAYGARCRGTAPALTEPAHYFDFVVAQQSWMRDHVEAQQLPYWRERLAELPPMRLPLDRPRSQTPSFRGASCELFLPPELVHDLTGLSRREGATLFMVLLAGYYALLHRYTQQDDLSVATPIANRSVKESEGILGLFVNTLILRCDLKGEPTFRALLGRVRQLALEAYQHQDLPFDRLIEALRPARGAEPIPLVQTVFALQNTADTALTLAGLEPAQAEFTAFTVRCDLEFHLWQTADGISGQLLYNTALFDAATGERLVRHYQRILVAVARDPELAVSRIPMLSESEQADILRCGRAPQPPLAASVPALFEEQVRQRPQQAALSCQGRSVSYHELNERANRMARALREKGVGPGVAVAVHMDRGPAMIVALLAILKTGGFYVPLDPENPVERNESIIEEVKGVLTLVTSTCPLSIATRPQLVVDEVESTLAGYPGEDLGQAITLEDLCYITFTSGSTGRPKGVITPHRGVIRLVKDTNYVRLDPDQRVLFLGLLAFDVSTFEIWGALLNGATLVIATPERPALADLGRLIRAEAVTTAAMPTGFFHLFLQERPEDLRSLQQILAGGDVLSPEAANRALANNREGTLINSYGPTENTSLTCCYPMRWPEQIAASVPIGRAISGTWVYVLDEHRQLVPLGAIGELYAGGSGVAQGYCNQPELTAERFPPDPFAEQPGALMYRTGDLVRMRPDGIIEFIGRNDDLVKVRGFRIERGEVERALRSHPEVQDAAVLSPIVAGEKRLVGYVVPRRPDGAEEESGPGWGQRTQGLRAALDAHLSRLLPDYMIPSELVFLPRWPLNSRGKLDRSKLPLPSVPRPAPGHAAPRNEVEQTLLTIWRHVLRHDAVGSEDNFFEVGGHSLLVTQVCDRIGKALGREVTPVEMFEYATIRKMAAYLTQRQAPTGPLRPAPAAPAPASPAVAIIGMAGRFPGAPDTRAFWQNLRSGIASVCHYDDAELRAFGVAEELLQRPDYVKARGRLGSPFDFDAAFFNYSAREAELMDPQHRLFLECAHEALEDAGYDPFRHPGAIGVYGGTGDTTYLHHILSQARDIASAARETQVFFGNYRDFMPTRVSYKLNLRGPAVGVQTACSTSLVAVITAAQALVGGHCDLALAGGAAVRTPHGYLYEPGGILSPDGHCRAFDQRAQGTVIGDGAAIVVLKRLEDAVADRDNIYAVLRGYGLNNDGSDKAGYTAPGVAGQSRAISAALDMAGGAVEDITYVEAHGTGTAVGDPVELSALTQAFRQRTARKQFCAIGSVKTNVGHLDAAAGITGLIKTALALQHGELPPSLHFEAPNPAIDFGNSPFFVQQRLTPWPRGPRPRRAGVSSFGIGGTNAHVIIEEAPAAAEPAVPARPYQLLVFSARTPAALQESCRRTADFLRERTDVALADAAFTLQVGRREHPERWFTVCRDGAELATRLPLPATPRVATGAAPAVTFLLSGQGSQYVGMGRALYEREPSFKKSVDLCCDYLRPLLPADPLRLLYPDGPQDPLQSERLQKTCFAQPLLFVVEYATAQLLSEWGLRPAALIGHSVGELVAAHLAGVFTLEDALAIVAARGRLMQAMPAGSMLAVDGTEAEARELLAQCGAEERVAIAALNAPGVTVLSGPSDSISELQRAWEGQGRAARRLHTSHAFHSAMMDACLPEFRACLAKVRFREPKLPFISNLTGDWARAEEVSTAEYWVRHLRDTVRFSVGVRCLLAAPERVFVEIGPGDALLKLTARHLGEAERERAGRLVPTLAHAREQRDAQEFILQALGKLWQLGAPVDWAAFQKGQPGRRRPLPGYPFERRRHLFVAPRSGAPASRASAGTPVPPPDTTTAPLAKKSELADWFYLPAWTAQPLPEQPAPGRTYLLLTDATPFGQSLGEAGGALLSAAGMRWFHACCGEWFEATANTIHFRPAVRQDYDELLATVRAAAGDGIIHIAQLRAFTETPDAGPSGYDYYQDLLLLAQAMGRQPAETRFEVTVVTNYQHLVRAGDRLCPDKAVLLGPALVIPLEYANVSCHCVDFAGGSLSWPELLPELTRAPVGEAVVAYREGRRYVRRFSAQRVHPQRKPRLKLRENGTYLITGGLGGIGLHLAEYLIKEYGAKVALTGRAALPPPEVWEYYLQDRVRVELSTLTPLLERTQGRPAQVHGELVAKLLPRLEGSSAGRPFRILEVGGGADSLDWTRATGLLEQRPGPRSEPRIEYHFADPDKGVVAAVAERGSVFLRAGVLDLARDGRRQGYEHESFDLIIGVNLSRIAPSTAEAVFHLHNLLAPGGVLALIEAEVEPWIPRWRDALHRRRFSATWTRPHPGPAADSGLAGLALAQKAPSAECRGSWLAAAGPDEALKRRLRKLADWQRSGAQVAVYQADVADEARMGEVLADLRRRCGRVDGVLHTAAVFHDGMMQLKDPERALPVLRTKIDGARVLDRLLAADPPDFVVHFSSMAAVTGTYAQSDYCAANAFLDAWAAAGQGSPTVSINWGIWRDAGAGVQLMTQQAVDRTTTRFVDHPLFDSCYQVDEDRLVYSSSIGLDSHWIVAEHRVQGVGTVPGTALLEMARAACAEQLGTTELELYEVYLFELLRVRSDRWSVVRTVLSRVEQGWRFAIESLDPTAGGPRWRSHAAGQARRLTAAAALVAPERIRGACSRAANLNPEGGPVSVGPRWTGAVCTASFGEHEALAELILPAEFHADLRDYALHPALLDVALGFALGAGLPYMPYRYGSVKVWKPLPARFYCHAAYQADTGSGEPDLAYDFTLFDEAGQELARISQYRLKPAEFLRATAEPARRSASGAPAATLPAQALLQPGILDLLPSDEPFPELAPGMSVSEGMEALCRVLDHGFVQTAVSTQDLDALLAEHQPERILRRKQQSLGKPRPSSGAAVGAASDFTPDGLQRLLGEIWHDVLGVEVSDPRVSFFDLHGDSLLAIKMLSRVRERLGVALTPHALISNPTIGDLTRLLQGQAPNRATSPVVPIRSAERGTPTFFVHPVGGSVFCYTGLGRRWPADGAFYALQARGIEDDTAPLTTVEELAESYCEAIRRIQPRGPYHLGGWSLGGTVAFEMARRLHSRGEVIERLVLIDSTSPTTARVAKEDDTSLLAALRKDLHELGAVASDGSDAVSEQQLKRLFRVFKANYGAWLRYRCEEPLIADALQAIAFVAQDGDAQAAATEIANWHRALPGRLRVHYTPGNHYSILARQNLERLLEQLHRELASHP